MNTTNVSIGGNNYLIKGDKDEKYVQVLASIVDNKFQEIKQQSAQLSNMQALVLIALNFADELQKSRQDYQKLVAMLENKQVASNSNNNMRTMKKR